MNTKRSAKAAACVLGDMDLVRPLGVAGIPVVVAAPPGCPTLYSRYTREALPWPEGADAGADLLDSLIRFGMSQPEPPVLFYEGDTELQLISRNRERLEGAFRFVLPEAELVENLLDKGRFTVLADRLDLPVPASRRIRPHAEPDPGDLDLTFPVIVKPLVRLASWTPIGGTYKALQVDTASELRDLWPRLAASGLEFLVQELIPGPESRIESYHVYVDAEGDVAAEFTGQKIRTLPTMHGHSTSLVITDAADVAELGRELARRLELRGVAKFDFKRRPDGRLALLEINPRFTLWHNLGAAAGVNVPALVYCDLVGRPRPAVNTPRAGMRWCTPLDDWRAAKESGVSLASWLRWALGCEVKSRFAWDDPMPFLRPKLNRLLSRLARAGSTAATPVPVAAEAEATPARLANP
jgi:D-aspartate ligase